MCFAKKKINQSIHKVIEKWTKIDLCICKDTLSPEKKVKLVVKNTDIKKFQLPVHDSNVF